MMTRHRSAVLAAMLVLAGCGGGSGGTDPTASNASATNAGGSGGSATGVQLAAGAPYEGDPLPNELPVAVDGGPGLFWFTGRKVINTLYATVTVCTPGSATECQTIDHVAVDTGSVGLRLLNDALSGPVAPKPLAHPASGSALRECVQFADGYTWGSLVTADVQIGGRKLADLPLNLIGDPAAGPAPRSCVSGPSKSSVSAFGANGVLGVGGFLRDCGPNCAAAPTAGWYYVCPGNACRSTALPLEQQVPNPVARLASDNNGVTLRLPAVPPHGASAAQGTLYFGVDTQADNALSGARLFTLDGVGTLLTSYAGGSQRAIVDTGANGYFFNGDIARCARNKAFYCPAVAGQPTSLQQTASIVGRNGTAQTVNFSVDNVDQVYTSQTVLPGLGAPLTDMVGGAATVFTWGLPFFFGRTIHVLFEGHSAGGTTGPAVAF